MALKTMIAGRWNRHSSSRPEAVNLWRKRNQFDKGEITDPLELTVAAKQLSAVLIKELEEAGVDIVCNGDFAWDSIFDVARYISGCGDFQTLSRIPGTNHFHRQPVVTLFPDFDWPLKTSDIRATRQLTSKPIVVSLPGPYSLARQTQNQQQSGLDQLVVNYARVLNNEIWNNFNFSEDSNIIIRIEDPQILEHPEDWEFYRTRVAKILVEDLSVEQIRRIIFATWFKSINHLHSYFDLPFGGFWLDLVDGRESIATLKDFPKNKLLIAGIFDARQTYQESFADLDVRMKEVVKYVDLDRIIIAPNTDLHFLPWDEAIKKVKRIVEYARSYQPILAKSERVIRLRSPRLIGVVDHRKDLDFTLRPTTIAFPTSTVGSFPQIQELRQARLKFNRGQLHPHLYNLVVQNLTLEWMNFQESTGIDVPVSGEFDRGDMAAWFGVGFGGRELDFVPSYENRRYKPIEYNEAIEYDYESNSLHDRLVDEVEFLEALTAKPIKITLTGPATLADWGLISHHQYYHDRRKFREGFVKALRTQIAVLINMGVRVIQIDEPALTAKMDYFHLDIEAIANTIAGFENKAYFILHICYSDIESLNKAFPEIVALPFHQVHMEMANRGDALKKLIEKYGFGGKDIGFGVLDVHTDRLETQEEITENVRWALDHFSPEQIWLTPDCGLKERSVEVSQAKIRVMCESANWCRKNLVVAK